MTTRRVMHRAADVSECGRYRYSLERRWAPGMVAVFVLLNPSTADATYDDATVRRCMNFAQSWGMAGIFVLNLYAYRATNPRELWQTTDPIGPQNDRHLAAYARAAQEQGAPLIAGWGTNARADRIAQVLALPGMKRLAALATTKAGQPCHPLRLRSDLTPQPWAGGAA